MASHFASEFAKIFSTTGCTIEGYDWNQPHYFDPNAECYAAETALISELTSEARQSASPSFASAPAAICREPTDFCTAAGVLVGFDSK